MPVGQGIAGEARRDAAGRIRTPKLLRPVGRSRWGMAAALALALGAILVTSVLAGRAELGSAVGLGFVLTAVPELPGTLRAALETICVRAVTVVAGGVIVVVCAPHSYLLAGATVAAAVFGALVPRVGATAGLSVVLIAIDLGGAAAGIGALYPHVVGAAVVGVAWLVWFGSARLLHLNEVTTPTPRSAGPGPSHALRVGVAMGLAVSAAALLPEDVVGGHWLVTSVLLTIQPSRWSTGVRLVQRLSGNTVGAVIAAVVLGTQPPAPVAIGVTVGLFVVAMALRPVNYTWWAITGPPVLLVISEYPELFPWYEGGVRLAMNLGGAVIVVLVVFAIPMLARRLRSRVSPGRR
ncbi:MAG TPA: FUSC family protein [Mycobacterium sp.]|nr:FUSC family protein [Mycobacterium sp.]